MAGYTWKKLFRLEVMTLFVVLVAFIGALWFSLSMMGFSRQPRSPDRFSPAVETKLDEALERVIRRGRVPGATVGVWIPGRGTWVKSLGTADRSAGAPMQETDTVRIGSITKTFVATVALQLVAENRLSLDDTLSTFIPSYPNARSLTVRGLMNHTSGLFDFVADPEFERQSMQDPLRVWNPEELLAFSTAQKPYFEPGGGWHYSNTNYILLGMIIERITGRPLADEVNDRILKPLGMKATAFPSDASMKSPFAKGYVESRGNLVEVSDIDPSIGWASAAMTSNLYDMKTWVEALADGKLLSPALQGERRRWVGTGDPSGKLFYGLGLVDYAGFIGHDGNAYGYSVAAYHEPSANATIVVILNKAAGTEMSANKAFAEFAGVVLPAELRSVD